MKTYPVIAAESEARNEGLGHANVRLLYSVLLLSCRWFSHPQLDFSYVYIYICTSSDGLKPPQLSDHHTLPTTNGQSFRLPKIPFNYACVLSGFTTGLGIWDCMTTPTIALRHRRRLSRRITDILQRAIDRWTEDGPHYFLLHAEVVVF